MGVECKNNLLAVKIAKQKEKWLFPSFIICFDDMVTKISKLCICTQDALIQRL